METPVGDLHQVETLTESQIAQFKRDGLLVLPDVLDPDLCQQVRDQLWDTIAEHRPSMKRDDPSTWVPFEEGEADREQRPERGGDAYFFGSGHRLFTRNGAEELLLDTAGARGVERGRTACWARGRWYGRRG